MLTPVLKIEEIQEAKTAFLNLTNQLTEFVGELVDPLEQIQAVLDFFYGEQVFSEPPNKSKIAAFSLVQTLAQHSGASPFLAIILTDLFQHIDINAHTIIAKQGALIRIELAQNQFVFIKASDGLSFDWSEVESYLKLETSDLEVSKSPADLNIVDAGVLNLLLLNLYKAELIDRGEFETAFKVSQLIIQHDPENPYERRDRGFLLQQLDCSSFAVADYEYFIEQCPTDPLAQILKVQLADMNAKQQAIH